MLRHYTDTLLLLYNSAAHLCVARIAVLAMHSTCSTICWYVFTTDSVAVPHAKHGCTPVVAYVSVSITIAATGVHAIRVVQSYGRVVAYYATLLHNTANTVSYAVSTVCCSVRILCVCREYAVYLLSLLHQHSYACCNGYTAWDAVLFFLPLLL